MDNAAEQRCTECGTVDSPISVGPGPLWLAIALWASAGLIWVLGFALEVVWLGYMAAIVLLGAFIYTLWYFFRRERACRHCGSRNLENAGAGGDRG